MPDTPGKLSDAELSRTVRSGFQAEPPDENAPEAKKRNLALALDELAHISALHQHPSFQWFYQTIIRPGFQKSRESLEAVDTPDADLPKLAASFRAWREIARALDERELVHRRAQNPNDPVIELVQERLDLH